MTLTRFIPRTLFLLIISLLLGCSTTLHPKIWDTSDAKSPYFPELHDEDYKSKGYAPGTNFGVAFSGGGTRSAPASIGQLIGLKETGLMEKIDYFSVISGGAWAVIPYVYLPQDKDEAVFLGGSYIPPKKLRNCDLFKSYLRKCSENYEPPVWQSEYQKFNDLCIDPEKKTIPDFMPLTESIFCNGRVIGKALWSGFNLVGDEIFSDVLSQIFLDPYGLGPQRFFGRPTKRKFFAWMHCPDAYRKKDLKCPDFNLVTRPRPFLVASGTLMLDKENKDKFYHLEMTPLYTSVRKRHEFKYSKDYKRGWKRKHVPNWEKGRVKATVGGMYIESFGYDSKKPVNLLHNKNESNPHQVEVEISKAMNIFSLENMIATTGAAPQETFRKAPFYLKVLANNFGWPEHYYWTNQGEINGTQEKPHGDGGHMDNYGLMPLLGRRVKNILVFINEFTPYSYHQITSMRTIDDNVVSYFDLANKHTTYRKIFKHYPHNVVFKQGILEKLFANFDTQSKNGEPLLSCHKNLKILPNERYGIRGSNETSDSYTPNICFLYLSLPRRWLDEIDTAQKLSGKVKNDILYRSGPFKRFPHYRTFFEDAVSENGTLQGAIIKMSFEKTKLLSNLTAWSVIESETEIRETFSMLGHEHGE